MVAIQRLRELADMWLADVWSVMMPSWRKAIEGLESADADW
jgi:hypothetical protein